MAHHIAHDSSRPQWDRRSFLAAALRVVDKPREIRHHRPGQRVRLATAAATKLNDGRLLSRTRGEQRSEVGVGRDDDSILSRCSIEDHRIVRAM